MLPETEFDQQYLEMEAEMRRLAQRSVSGWQHSPKALLENKAEALAVWLMTYFPHKVPEVEPWQDEPITLMAEESRAMELLPAGTMKTTIGSELYPIWRICQNRNSERLGLFKDDEFCKDSLRAIKTELLVNEKLIKDYGRFIPQTTAEKRVCRWTEHAIDVIGRTRRSRSSTIRYMAWGARGSLGYRCHQTHIDDAVTEDIAYSPEMTRQFMSKLALNAETTTYTLDSQADWFPFDGMPIMEQVLIFGTRFAPKDPYGKIIERNNQPDMLDNPDFRPYKVCIVDLIKDEEKQETITPRWPWSRAMAKKAEMGDREFSMRYRNNPVDASMQRIKEIWVRGGMMGAITYPGCRDATLTCGDVIRRGDMVAIGYDPQSGSKTRHAKYGAVSMIANRPGPTNNWSPRLCDWWMGQTLPLDMTDPDSQVNVILRMAHHANCMGVNPTVVLEANQVQIAFKEPILSEAQKRGIMLTVETSFTLGEKHDRETGIEAVAIDFQNGWLRIPAQEIGDVEHFLGFEDQMIAFGTSKYSDVPISYWKARSYLYNRRFVAEPKEATVERWMPRWMKSRMERRGIGTQIMVLDAYAPAESEEDVDYATY